METSAYARPRRRPTASLPPSRLLWVPASQRCGVAGVAWKLIDAVDVIDDGGGDGEGEEGHDGDGRWIQVA